MYWRCVALVEAEVEDLDDVGVHEPRDGQRLAPEARDELVVVGQVLGQQLDGHVALEALVEGAHDGRHAADAEALAQLVATREDLAGHHGVVTPTDVPPVPVSVPVVVVPVVPVPVVPVVAVPVVPVSVGRCRSRSCRCRWSSSRWSSCPSWSCRSGSAASGSAPGRRSRGTCLRGC